MATEDIGRILIEVEDEARDLEDDAKKARAQRRLMLQDVLEVEEERSKAHKKHSRELKTLELEDDIENLKKKAAEAKTIREQEAYEQEIKEKEKEKQRVNALANAGAKMTENLISGVMSGIAGLYNTITSSAKEYGSYVDRIQTRLLGANETYGSITDKLSGVFGASPIFQMKGVMDKVATAVEKGINFNVEARAAMEVLKDKVAATFNAFDSSLLRIIRIQQADSTQARLGMESMLTEFLNRNYQDSSYLSGLSDTVTANLLEATSLRNRDDSVAFEYAVQKWLGAFSSVGASDALIQSLSQGIGYLASGNVSALSSNSQLEQLLVAAANRGGANYGSMLTEGVTVQDVNAVMTGLYSLVKEISNSNNNVALSQYAQLFGMTVSDIQSVLNIADEGLQEISADMADYGSLVQRVVDETSLSKLISRTGAASLGDNLVQNFLWETGSQIGKNVFSYASWQVAGMVSDLLTGIETGVDIQPFGVGTHMNLDVGTLAKVATTSVGALAGIGGMLQNAASIAGVNLGALGEETAKNTVVKGNLVSFAEAGTRQTSSSYTGDFSDGALAQSSTAITDKAVAEHTDDSFDEEKKKTEEAMKSMQEIGDNVKFIVQLLNETGIVIRGRAGYTQPVNFFNSIMEDEDISVIGVTPV